MSMRSVAMFVFLGCAGMAHAEGCITKPIDMNMPGVNRELAKRIRAVFPTLINPIITNVALLGIGPADCNAPDVAERKVRVEAMLQMPVILYQDDSGRDFDFIPLGRRDQIDLRKRILAIFPTLTTRGLLFDRDVEVLYLADSDLHAKDVASRQMQVEAIVGKPVVLRLETR
ncbi:hypothetical protein XarbCFBP7408_20805 [Xanthomonas arboricola pv. guizotiae]|uniref:Uncharacterized protein n=2 Tax=Xanthomonas arboricola TaxID=56448 RepID=A0A2S6ZPB0_9XANT|nr:hypothetical protein XarbCFBP7409_20155 [Xanthomonas arboricola pv. guizotiae]PPU17974.1 hypothetical protein XarbCFBP7408_20805 [Xanthomonas arboricola pv. guizotiae]